MIYCEWRNEMGVWSKRVLFTKLLGEFIVEANKREYNIALGPVYVKDVPGNGHKENSLHYLGLAADFILYTDQGDYLTDEKDYIALDVLWESMHPDTWSGIRFDDSNHISLTHDGRK